MLETAADTARQDTNDGATRETFVDSTINCDAAKRSKNRNEKYLRFDSGSAANGKEISVARLTVRNQEAEELVLSILVHNRQWNLCL